MTTITQSITALPVAPDPATMTRTEFSAAAAAFVIAQKAEAVELETFRTQVNTVKGEMVTHASDTAADAVSTAADAVATAADAIATAADRVQTGIDAAAASASAASAAAIANAFIGTSTTSWTPAVESKAFTTQAGELYTAGIYVTVVSAAAPTAYGWGQVTSYTGTTLTVDVQLVGGSGAHTDWNISLAGVRGATGATGAGITEQATGFTATGGTTPKTLTVDADFTTSGFQTTSSPEFAALNIGHASDTTLTRVSAGKLAQEGVTLADVGVNNFTAAQNFARATVASHATTADIWAAAGNQIDWTGTETTTAFPNAPQAGAERVLICAGACSFTAGANMLIDGVASAATVTCAAGDSIIVRAVSTTQFKLSRVKYDGTAQVSAGGGSWVYLSTVTASASATVDVETTFDSTYDAYVIVLSNVVLSADNVVINIRFKMSGAYVTSSTYVHKGQYGSTGGVGYTYYNAGSGAPVSEIRLGIGGAAASATLSATVRIHGVSSATGKKMLYFDGMSSHDGFDGNHFIGSGTNTTAAAVTGVRFFPASGTITSGTFRLYGIKNS